MLLIGEKILLICSKNNNNNLKLVGKEWFLKNFLSASILHDLKILGILVLEKWGKFELQREKPTGNLFLQRILDTLLGFRSKHIMYLMKFLGKKKWNLENNLWKELENKGIIQNQAKEHILIKLETRDEIINNLRTYLIKKSEPDASTRALFGLLRHSGLWKISFRRSEWDKKWVKEITSNDKISKIYGSSKKSRVAVGLPPF